MEGVHVLRHSRLNGTQDPSLARAESPAKAEAKTKSILVVQINQDRAFLKGFILETVERVLAKDHQPWKCRNPGRS